MHEAVYLSIVVLLVPTQDPWAAKPKQSRKERPSLPGVEVESLADGEVTGLRRATLAAVPPSKRPKSPVVGEKEESAPAPADPLSSVDKEQDRRIPASSFNVKSTISSSSSRSASVSSIPAGSFTSVDKEQDRRIPASSFNVKSTISSSSSRSASVSSKPVGSFTSVDKKQDRRNPASSFNVKSTISSSSSRSASVSSKPVSDCTSSDSQSNSQRSQSRNMSLPYVQVSASTTQRITTGGQLMFSIPVRQSIPRDEEIFSPHTVSEEPIFVDMPPEWPRAPAPAISESSEEDDLSDHNAETSLTEGSNNSYEPPAQSSGSHANYSSHPATARTVFDSDVPPPSLKPRASESGIAYLASPLQVSG